MKPALIILAILAVAGLILYLLDRRQTARGATENAPEASHDVASPATDGCADECCAAHEVCPSEQLLRSEMRCETVYYDDYELDEFAGRRADEYTEEEVEQFRDILYTLRHDDMLGWERSLKRRGVIMPTPIHEEFVALYNS